MNSAGESKCKEEETLDSCDLANAIEPVADEDWLKAFEKELKENDKRKQMLEEIRRNTPI